MYRSTNITNCPFYNNGNCEIAKSITEVGLSCIITEDKACETCIKCDKPRDLNKVTISLALFSLRKENKEKAKEIHDKYKHMLSAPQVMPGPGTELGKLLTRLNITQGGCSCPETAAKMNELGSDGCRREIESLIPEVDRNAKEKGWKIPKQEFFIKNLILAACDLYDGYTITSAIMHLLIK